MYLLSERQNRKTFTNYGEISYDISEKTGMSFMHFFFYAYVNLHINCHGTCLSETLYITSFDAMVVEICINLYLQQMLCNNFLSRMSTEAIFTPYIGVYYITKVAKVQYVYPWSL